MDTTVYVNVNQSIRETILYIKYYLDDIKDKKINKINNICLNIDIKNIIEAIKISGGDYPDDEAAYNAQNYISRLYKKVFKYINNADVQQLNYLINLLEDQINT
jgi:hypothetical protein